MEQRSKTDSAVKKRALSWDDLLTLSTLARQASYGATARALDLTRATVVRRMRRLELALGYQLVEESQGKVRLTPDALRVVATAHEMNELVRGIGQAGHEAGPRLAGRVRVTAPEGIATCLLAPALAALRRQHPGLGIELQVSMAVLSLSHKETDIAVRLAAPSDGNLVALALPPLRYAMMAARAALASAGADALPLAGYDRAAEAVPESAYLRRHYPQREPALRSNSLLAQVEAIRHGAACGLLPLYMLGRYPELTTLPGAAPMEKPAWIVFHGAQRGNPAIQAVRTWLRSTLEAAFGDLNDSSTVVRQSKR